MITIEDFKKLDIRIATIISVENHPNADKLYILKISLGKEQRQIVAGLRKDYSPEQLLNKQIIVVTNLEPAKLRGIESNGMLLAASDDRNNLVILTTEKKIENNSKVG